MKELLDRTFTNLEKAHKHVASLKEEVADLEKTVEEKRKRELEKQATIDNYELSASKFERLSSDKEKQIEAMKEEQVRLENEVRIVKDSNRELEDIIASYQRSERPKFDSSCQVDESMWDPRDDPLQELK